MEEKSYSDKAIEDANFLDRLKLTNARDVELAKEKTKQAKIEARDARHARRMKYLSSEFGKVIVGWVAAVILGLCALLGCSKIFGWGHHPTVQPTDAQVMQEREKSCVGSTWTGSTGKVWWPDYKGVGICLPKGQTPPEGK